MLEGDGKLMTGCKEGRSVSNTPSTEVAEQLWLCSAITHTHTHTHTLKCKTKGKDGSGAIDSTWKPCEEEGFFEQHTLTVTFDARLKKTPLGSKRCTQLSKIA